MNKDNILVLENQIDFKPIKSSQIKQKSNYIIFCGRLNKSKRPEDVIQALAKSSSNNLKLIIIGNGNEKYKQYLIDLTKKLNLGNRVEFTGSISNEKRNNIMQKALAIVVTSVREGWGLIVTEANANGTIAITYNIEGLRDANTKETGFITKSNSPNSIAESIDLIIKSPKLRQSMELKALQFANAHSNWNKQVRRLEQWIKK